MDNYSFLKGTYFDWLPPQIVEMIFKGFLTKRCFQCKKLLIHYWLKEDLQGCGTDERIYKRNAKTVRLVLEIRK